MISLASGRWRWRGGAASAQQVQRCLHAPLPTAVDCRCRPARQQNGRIAQIGVVKSESSRDDPGQRLSNQELQVLKFRACALQSLPFVCVSIVRRQNIWRNSQRKLAECGPRLGVYVRRQACGAASADARWSVA